MTATDDLIAQLERDAKAWAGTVGPTPRLEREAAAELTRLQGRVAELHDNGTRLLEAADSWKDEAQRNQRLVKSLEADYLWHFQRAERAEIYIKKLEAEIARLQKGREIIEDRLQLQQRAERAEAERDELRRLIADGPNGDLFQWKAKAYSAEAGWSSCSKACAKLQDERDALRADAERWMNLLIGYRKMVNDVAPYFDKPITDDNVVLWMNLNNAGATVDAAIDAARKEGE